MPESTEKDRVIAVEMAKMRENWPKLAKGKSSQIYRFFYALKLNLIRVIGKYIRDECDYAPTQKDLNKALAVVSRSSEEQEKAELESKLPVVTLEEKQRTAWFFRNMVRAMLAPDFDQYEAVMHGVAQQCRVWRLKNIADQLIEQIEQRRANEKQETKAIGRHVRHFAQQRRMVQHKKKAGVFISFAEFEKEGSSD